MSQILQSLLNTMVQSSYIDDLFIEDSRNGCCTNKAGRFNIPGIGQISVLNSLYWGSIGIPNSDLRMGKNEKRFFLKLENYWKVSILKHFLFLENNLRFWVLERFTLIIPIITQAEVESEKGKPSLSQHLYLIISIMSSIGGWAWAKGALGAEIPPVGRSSTTKPGV